MMTSPLPASTASEEMLTRRQSASGQGGVSKIIFKRRESQATLTQATFVTSLFGIAA
jgi:hypothetical protein